MFQCNKISNLNCFSEIEPARKSVNVEPSYPEMKNFLWLRISTKFLFNFYREKKFPIEIERMFGKNLAQRKRGEKREILSF
jgi:hypothetical protein